MRAGPRIVNQLCQSQQRSTHCSQLPRLLANVWCAFVLCTLLLMWHKIFVMQNLHASTWWPWNAGSTLTQSGQAWCDYDVCVVTQDEEGFIVQLHMCQWQDYLVVNRFGAEGWWASAEMLSEALECTFEFAHNMACALDTPISIRKGICHQVGHRILPSWWALGFATWAIMMAIWHCFAVSTARK